MLLQWTTGDGTYLEDWFYRQTTTRNGGITGWIFHVFLIECVIRCTCVVGFDVSLDVFWIWCIIGCVVNLIYHWMRCEFEVSLDVLWIFDVSFDVLKGLKYHFIFLKGLMYHWMFWKVWFTFHSCQITSILPSWIL